MPDRKRRKSPSTRRTPSQSRVARAAATEAAGPYVRRVYPGATDSRVVAQRPAGARAAHAAHVIARRPDGTELILLTRTGATEAAAFDALCAAMAAGECDRNMEQERNREAFHRAARAVMDNPFPLIGALFEALFGSRRVRPPPGAMPFPPPWEPPPEPPPPPAAPHADLRALDLDAMPDAEGLKRAWRAAAVKHHPDASGGSDAAFKAARAAYERLAARLGVAP